MMTRVRRKFGAWLGLLGIVLHAVVPLAGLAAYATPIASSGHHHAAHGNSVPNDAAGQLFDAHHAHEGAHGTPAAPGTFCVGDCPCCTSNYKVFLCCEADSWIVAQLPAKQPSPTPVLAPVFYKVPYDHPARAPPFRSWRFL
jgi:hypothetical protein